MTTRARLPDGFVVRLRDGIEPAPVVLSGSHVLRLSATAREMLSDRTLVVTSPASATLADRLLDLDLADPVPGVGPGIEAVSVVVPVRDNAAGVDRLLAQLPGLVSCVVVDDASTDPDGLARVVRRHGGVLVRLDRNVGPAAARDVGLREVRTPLVAFVDSDVDVSPATLGELAALFADPRLAAAAPRIRSHGGTRWFERYDDACGSLDLGPVPATVRPGTRVAYVPSACLVARVDMLGDGFDPRLRSGEDVDLVWRLHDAGHRVRYAAGIEARHDVRRSVGAWLGRKAFYGSSAAPLATRHHGRVAPAVLSPVGAATIASVLVQRRWSWPVAVALTCWQLRATWQRLPELPPRRRAELVGAATVGLARQTTGLALRHWWPVTAVLGLCSSRARRAAMAMAVVDGLVVRRSSGADLDPVRFTVARRLDDLAYGAGVWWGALRARSPACLLPRWTTARGRVDP